MVEEILKVVTEYKQRLRRSSRAPRLSYQHPMLAGNGGPNVTFFTCLCDEATALEFLQNVGLLRSKEQCKTCGGDMTWSIDQTVSDGYRWRCRRRNGGTRCAHQLYRGHVALREGLPRSVQQRGRLPLPPSALHVRGEVQDTRRTTFCTISSSRREHRLVAVRCATLHVILVSSPH